MMTGVRQSLAVTLASVLLTVGGVPVQAAELEEAPLTIEQIETLLQGRVGSLDVLLEARFRSLQFVPDRENLRRLERGGASQWLLDNISFFCNSVGEQRAIAMQELKKTRYERAIQSFTSAIEKAPRFLQCYQGRAAAFTALGKYDEAIDDLKQILAYQPHNLMARHLIAENLLKAERPEAAIESVDLVLLERPDSPGSHLLRARASMMRDDHGAALVDAYAALKVDPRNAKAYALAAKLLATSSDPKLRHPRAAIELARAATALAKGTEQDDGTAALVSHATAALAAAQAELGDFQKAVALLNQAIGASGLDADDQGDLEFARDNYLQEQTSRLKSREEDSSLDRSAVIVDLAEDLAVIAGGSFSMGSSSGPEDEQPSHKVTLPSYLIGRHEVTEKQWCAVLGRPYLSESHSADLPKDRVSWHDCQRFLTELNKHVSGDGIEFRLPSEAEWEYAAKAGTTSEYFFGDSESELDKFAWYDKNSERQLHGVGGLAPNPWGLFDVYGNVAEWCHDVYEGYSGESVSSPVGPSQGDFHVYRGGGRLNSAKTCRSTARSLAPALDRRHGLGFRLACTARDDQEVVRLARQFLDSQRDTQGFDRLVAELDRECASVGVNKGVKVANLYDMHFVAGYIRHKTGDYEAALSHFRECQKLVSTGTSSRYIVASCLVAWVLATCPESSMRDPELALSLSEDVLTASKLRDRQNSTNPWMAYATVAAANARSGKLERAEQAARLARDQSAEFRAYVDRALPASLIGPLDSTVLPLPIHATVEAIVAKRL